MSFPVRLEDGSTVQIVSKVYTDGEIIELVDELGNKYTKHPHIAHTFIAIAEKVIEAVEPVLEKVDAILHGLEVAPAGEAQAAPETEPEVEPQPEVEAPAEAPAEPEVDTAV